MLLLAQFFADICFFQLGFNLSLNSAPFPLALPYFVIDSSI